MTTGRLLLWHFPRLRAVIVGIVFLSLGVHDIHLNHVHPGNVQQNQKQHSHGHSLFASEYLHATDKKLFL